MSEMALAERVVAWLHEARWDVYQEVQVRSGGPRCDIVAVQGAVLWAIECKTTLGLSVLEQAHHWRRFANVSSIAVPPTRNWFGCQVATDYGIGVLTVRADRVDDDLRAVMRRGVDGALRRALRDEHRTWAVAGNPYSQFYSPFKATCREVQRFMEGRGAATMKEVVEGIRHHYTSTAAARSSLARWIDGGHIEGVSLRREGKRLLVEAA